MFLFKNSQEALGSFLKSASCLCSERGVRVLKSVTVRTDDLILDRSLSKRGS